LAKRGLRRTTPGPDRAKPRQGGGTWLADTWGQDTGARAIAHTPIARPCHAASGWGGHRLRGWRSRSPPLAPMTLASALPHRGVLSGPGYEAARQPEPRDRRAAPEGADRLRRWRGLSHGDRVWVGGRRCGLRPPASGATTEAHAEFAAVFRLVIRLAGRPITLRSMTRIGGHRRRYSAGFFRQMTISLSRQAHSSSSSGLTCASSSDQPLVGPGQRHHDSEMFVVSESEAAAIRTAFEQEGELSAAIELRRLFPGITDNLQARECARVIAGWKPLPPRPARRLRHREP
jgi:hypothetical protein